MFEAYNHFLKPQTWFFYAFRPSQPVRLSRWTMSMTTRQTSSGLPRTCSKVHMAQKKSCKHHGWVSKTLFRTSRGRTPRMAGWQTSAGLPKICCQAQGPLSQPDNSWKSSRNVKSGPWDRACIGLIKAPKYCLCCHSVDLQWIWTALNYLDNLIIPEIQKSHIVKPCPQTLSPNQSNPVQKPN